MDHLMNRRELLRAGAAGGAALGAAGLASNSLIERALASGSRCGSLKDIQHVVILIQENRSFDHYFGSYAGVRGFADRHAPKAGTAGEYLTQSPLPTDASGVAGPIGLGFRVPMLVVSPFSRGGFVSSQTFDHTSTLRFLETRFGVPVANLSKWRRSVTGNLTSAFNFARVDTSLPSLPQPSLTDPRVLLSSCAASAPLDLATDGTTTLKQLGQTVVPSYPVTVNSAPPPQEPGRPRRPSGRVRCAN